MKVEDMDQAGIERAADQLFEDGFQHQWWSRSLGSNWRDLDPLGQSEFLDIVTRIVSAYHSPPSKTEG
jgi:hypothetical protein